MLDFLTRPDVEPFTIAGIALLALLALELFTLLIGKPLSALIDHAVGYDGHHLDVGHVELDHAIDHAHVEKPPTMFGTALDWINAGRVPILVLIVLLLAAFAAIGFTLQTLVGVTGHLVPKWIAVALVVAPAVVSTRWLSKGVSKVVPRDETYALGGGDLVGSVGTVTVGPVRKGVVARARIADRHGNVHFPRVEPADPEHVIPAGASVLVVEVRGGALAVAPADPRLIDDKPENGG